MTGCVGQRSEENLFFLLHSELLRPSERESCLDLTSVQLADAPFYVKYSILRPPCLPNPEPFRTL